MICTLVASSTGIAFLRGDDLKPWHTDRLGVYLFSGQLKHQLETYLPLMSAPEQRDYVIRNLWRHKL